MKRGISTNRDMSSQAATLKTSGIDFVFRYYSTTTTQAEKRLTVAEAQALSAAGLEIGVVYEDAPTNATYFSWNRGHQDGVNAYNAARTLAQPIGTCIYFAVDYDASSSDITGPITQYFQGVSQGMNDANQGLSEYMVGVYGSGSTCSGLLSSCPFIAKTWLAESKGWSGSKTFTTWDVNQSVATACLCDLQPDEYEDNQALDDFGGWSFAVADSTANVSLDAASAPPPNVDTTASNQQRVDAMWNVVTSVATDFDSPSARDNTQRFMMYIAWHEGDRVTQRVQQGNGGTTGPARSFFQVECASALTAYHSSSMTQARLQLLADDCNVSYNDLVQAFESLTPTSSYPAGNLVAQLLETSDIFGAYVARALLWTFSPPLPLPAIPPTLQFQPQADYWFKYWHGNVGDPASLKQAFIDHCTQVDPLLPPTPSNG